MINEERIVLMTKLASYEKGEGKQSMAVGKYFRGDYISLHLLKTVISGTLAYLLCFGVYLLYYFEDIMANLYNMDFALFARNIIYYYVIFLNSWIFFVFRYYQFSCW